MLILTMKQKWNKFINLALQTLVVLCILANTKAKRVQETLQLQYECTAISSINLPPQHSVISLTNKTSQPIQIYEKHATRKLKECKGKSHKTLSLNGTFTCHVSPQNLNFKFKDLASPAILKIIYKKHWKMFCEHQNRARIKISPSILRCIIEMCVYEKIKKKKKVRRR